MNPQVDNYLLNGCGRCALKSTPQCKVNTWKKELIYLRMLLQTTGLEEELKWGVPCYTHKNKNILLVSAFKHYCVISFFKGALLKDEHKVLGKPGENSRTVRLIRFRSLKEIQNIETILAEYIQEAIGIEESGRKISPISSEELSLPEELQEAFKADPKLMQSFKNLTPGRQRAYVLYFSAPRQSKTRWSRIEKYTPKILQGIGLNDR